MFYTLEVLGNKKKLSVTRGLIEIHNGDADIATVPLDAVSVVLVAGFGISYSHNFLLALGEHAIPLVLCNKQFYPEAILLPLEAHGMQSKIQKAQVQASVPKQKQLWKQIVQAKIQGHCNVLCYYGIDASPLSHYIAKVHSGDSSNVEGTAASTYWKLLFSPSFRRNQDGGDSINIMLNYAYTVLRALVARAVVTSGLHYSFGLYHCNARNSMPLVDDLMEPFRCFAEKLVMEAYTQGYTELNKDSKKILNSIAVLEVHHNTGNSIVYECIKKLCVSLAKVYMKEAEELIIYNTIG